MSILLAVLAFSALAFFVLWRTAVTDMRYYRRRERVYQFRYYRSLRQKAEILAALVKARGVASERVEMALLAVDEQEDDYPDDEEDD